MLEKEGTKYKTTNQSMKTQVELMKLATQEQMVHGNKFMDKFKDVRLPMVSPTVSDIAATVVTSDLQSRTGGKPKVAQASVVSDDPVAGFDPKTGGMSSSTRL